MTEALDWKGRVGDVWAEEWPRTDRALAPIGDALVEAAAAELEGLEAPHVLDVGCGAGTVALQLAERIEGARIVGLDLSEPLVAVARRRADRNERVRFEIADAASWPAGDQRFDLIMSRHGVMFFEYPVTAFAHLRALGQRQVRLVFSCFRARSENPWVAIFDPIARRFAPDMLAAPPPPVGPFAFADSERVARILRDAGFESARFEPLDVEFVAGAGEDPLADAVSYFQRIGPFARLMGALGEDDRRAAVDQLAEILSTQVRGGLVRLRAAAWIVRTRAS